MEEQAVEPGRPYREFVENEAGQYCQETVRDPRNRYACRKLMGVAAMVEHAIQKGWIKPPYSNPYRSPSYIDALIQLADDANWLAREIPLPEHPDPQHPTIFYTVDPVSNRPIPREDSYIRGDYVYENGARVTTDDRIFPLPIPVSDKEPDPILLLELELSSCFTLEPGPENVEVKIHWLEWKRNEIRVRDSLLKCLYFAP